MPKHGDKVKVEYIGTLDDGSQFDRTDEPFEFEIGAGQVITGFEEAVSNMEVSEEKTVKLTPDKAYGVKDPMKIKEVPRQQLPADIEIGTILMLSLPTGARIPAKVTDIGSEKLTIDLNHPLAGRNLTFKLKLLEVK